jgi:hypothetical protein
MEAKDAVLDNYELIDEQDISQEDVDHLLEDWRLECPSTPSSVKNVVNLNRHIRILPTNS